MEQADTNYGVHVLLSAVKYLDREHGYGDNLGGRVPPERTAIHKAIGTLTDRLPESAFLELLEDRKDFWAKPLKTKEKKSKKTT